MGAIRTSRFTTKYLSDADFMIKMEGEDSTMDAAYPPESSNLLGDKNKPQEENKELPVARKKCFITVEPIIFLTFFGSNLSGTDQ